MSMSGLTRAARRAVTPGRCLVACVLTTLATLVVLHVAAPLPSGGPSLGGPVGAPATAATTVALGAGARRAAVRAWARCAASLAPRIQAYCNNPPALARDEALAPVPGSFLVHVAVNSRHGDRSAIHTLPETARATWPCDAPSAADVRWAAALLRPLHSSSACVVRGECAGRAPVHEGADDGVSDRIRAAVDAWRTARAEGDVCSSRGGELSSIGWSQLLRIGHSLGRRYGALLRMDAPGSTALRVVSTDTGRTVLSATALTQGLLAGAAAGGASAASDDDDDESEVDEGEGQEDGRADGGDGGGTAPAARQVQPSAPALPDPTPWHRRPLASHEAASTHDAAFAAGAGTAWRRRHRVPPLPQLGALPLPLHVVERPVDPMMATQGRGDACPRLVALLGPLRRPERGAAPAVAGAGSGTGDAAAPDAAGNDEDGDDGHPSALADLPPSLLSRIATVAGVPPRDLPGTEMTADDVLSRLCGGHALPCWRHAAGRPPELVLREMQCGAGAHGAATSAATAPEAAGVCLTVADAAAVLARADAHYARQYTSPLVRPLMFPFLSQIAEGMAQAAAGAPGAPRVVLRAAHDTVIAPVLAALNASVRAEPWPRYAARTAFELWADPGGGGGGGGGAPRARHWVRLVVDGVDATARLACAQLPPAGDAPDAGQPRAANGDGASAALVRPACPLEGFRALVQGLLSPFGETFEDACGAPML